ncbi:aminotransferase [Methylobrevis albus]|uniref:Aminotransferase n=1 Tax=Methylobrevis albus TaxID=2793297 RepID=A0A931I3V8_9HYPH|nr:aminotransferase [Methylobrevis albus]MBH0239762.1 aminotransferase [Methylobrevis albus]
MTISVRTASHFVNPLVAGTDAPPIPAAQAWIAGYGGGQGPLINLSQAVPGDPPAPALLAALAKAAGEPGGATYGPIVGDPALRAALISEMATIYGGGAVAPNIADVAITAGCNQAFFATMIALARAGDEVLLPVPWYFNHKMTLDMLGIGAVPLPARLEHGFVPAPEGARALIGPRTRAIVLVTPNNPTGAIYPPATIRAFAELCAETGIALVLDETYRDFLGPDAGAPHDLFTAPVWRGTVVQLYSFSKAFAIPGHRLGAVVADARTIAEIAKVLDCIQICAPRAAQAGLAAAMPGLADWRAASRATIGRRRDAFVAAMQAAPDWTIGSLGAYFAFVRHPFDLPAEVVTERLAREAGLLCLPGSWFGPGQEQFVRIAVANVDEAALAEVPARLRVLG